MLPLKKPMNLLLQKHTICMGVKHGHAHWGRNVGWECLRTGCWGEYLTLKGTRLEGSGENYIMRSLMICTPHQMLIRWKNREWDVARMGESRVACRVLVGEREGNRPFWRPRHRWEDNLKMDLQRVEWGGMDWIDLAEDRERWWAFVDMVMNIWVPYNVGIWLAENWLGFHEGLCSMELLSNTKLLWHSDNL